MMSVRWFPLFLLTVILAVDGIRGVPGSTKLRRQKRIVGGIAAAKPPPDDPVVFVNKNGRDARIYGNRDEHKGFYVFRGIRFGQPPVGRHRFQRPRGAFTEGDVNATSWGPPCPQPDGKNPNKIIGTEDCLFLNVFTPTLPDTGDGYPVLIWIHGGGFRRGAACQYEMRNLIKKNMIVVSIQYRLGSLGFLSTGGKELSGNNGMFDMTLAVNWVRDYIQFFGGDPKKIIAFGHGTGASSAILLSLSKLTQSTFSGLIAMSGSILSQFAVDKDPMAKATAIAKANECPTDNVPEMIRCLQELPVEKIINSDSILEKIYMSASGFITGLAGILGAGPVVDGEDDRRYLPNFLTETPEQLLKFGKFPKIPLLTGVLKDETAGAVFGGFREEIQQKLNTVPQFLNKDLIKSLQSKISEFGTGNDSVNFVPEAFSRYLRLIGGQDSGSGGQNDIGKVAEATGDALFNAPAFLTSQYWSKQAKTFMYSFDQVSKKSRRKNFLDGLPIVDAQKVNPAGLLGHGDDLGFIFGQNSIFGERLDDDGSSDPDDSEAEQVTDAFTDLIANFARQGEVSVTEEKSNLNELIKLPSFGGNTDDNSFLSISSKPRLMKNFRYCQMALWTGLVERLKSQTCGLFKSSVEMIQRVGKDAYSSALQTVNGVSAVGTLPKILGNVTNVNRIIPLGGGGNITKNLIQGFLPGSKPTPNKPESGKKTSNTNILGLPSLGGFQPRSKWIG